MVITTVLLAIAFAFVLLLFIVTRNAEKPEDRYDLWRFIVWSVIFGACFIFTIVWYAFIKPSNTKKIEIYRHELERLNAINVTKAMATYTLYGEDYKNEQIKKHRASVEESARIAEERAKAENKTDDVENDSLDKKDETDG